MFLLSFLSSPLSPLAFPCQREHIEIASEIAGEMRFRHGSGTRVECKKIARIRDMLHDSSSLTRSHLIPTARAYAQRYYYLHIPRAGKKGAVLSASRIGVRKVGSIFISRCAKIILFMGSYNRTLVFMT